jgi:hypothetical protein
VASPSGTRDLLSLPKEIRDKIWSEVLGDRTIHLRYTEEFYTPYWGGRSPGETRTPAKWKHDICVADLSEQAIYQQSIQDEQGIWRQDCDNHHDKCENKASTLDLRLLRTSHQIHKEASAILLRTNLFSINDEKCFVHFMQTLDPARKAMLAKLHLSLTWQHTIDVLFKEPPPDPDLIPWNEDMSATLIAQLSGLHTLHICMAQRFYNHMMLEKMKRMGLSWVAGLLRFGDHEAGAPSLKTVTVSLTDGALKNEALREEALTYEALTDEEWDTLKIEQKWTWV